MYTEDDEKVTVKKDNSKDDYNDFYTSFNEMDEEEPKDNKKKKNKKEVKEEKQLKEEIDYSSFYDDSESDDEEEPKYKDDNNNLKIYIKYGIIAVLVISLILLIIILLKGGNSTEPSTPTTKGDIELNSTSMSLTTGGSDYISYKVVNTESVVNSSFISSNVNVATVDSNGKVTAVGPGESIITIYYTIEGVDREKKVTVKVEGPKVNEELILNLKFVQGSENAWTNKDVIISVEAKTELGLSSLKYATNCSGSCNYTDVSNNKITISNNGTTTVTVKATDKKNKEVTKEVIVKIDKEAPTVTYSGNKNISSNKDVEVCVTCSDSISGCKQQKVCKKYTSSKSNQTITVTDNAGNTSKSSIFNVTIKKMTDPCTLSVSSDGTVKATLRESAKYYGFNSSYSGSNELSKKVDISGVTKNGDSGALVVWYYVLNKNGSGGKCFITVIKSCSGGKCTFKAN